MARWIVALLTLTVVAAPAEGKRPKKQRKAPPPVEAPAEPSPDDAVPDATATERMNNERLNAFIVNLLGEEAGPGARKAPNQWEFDLEGYRVMVITDENADRMRMMVPITPAAELPPGLERRMLQANFDAVLDARYAIAQGVVWSAFIHPLSPLDDDQLVSGLAQTVTAAATFGTAFTSGAFVFGGGDTQQIHEDLYRRILERSRVRDQGI